MLTKICTKCNIEKEIENFSFRKDSQCHRGACKVCNNNRYRYRAKDYYHQNKEKCKKTFQNWKNNNPDWHAEYRKNNKTKLALYKQNRRKDPLFKLIESRRHRRNLILKNHNSFISATNLGCSVDEWKQYIENQFDENMTWNNYGKYWHLDEIIPCSAWDQSNIDHQKACWHYLNSRPLEKHVNRTRSHGKNKDFTKEINQFLLVLRALGEI
jgi:hypothetical protein